MRLQFILFEVQAWIFIVVYRHLFCIVVYRHLSDLQSSARKKKCCIVIVVLVIVAIIVIILAATLSPVCIHKKMDWLILRSTLLQKTGKFSL